MRESRSYGSVRGAISDGRPYRNSWATRQQSYSRARLRTKTTAVILFANSQDLLGLRVCVDRSVRSAIR
jgi:hypothetical protein